MQKARKSRCTVKIWLAEGRADRQKSILWLWDPHLDSLFTILRRNELEPRPIPIDKKRYEVQFSHFDNGHYSRYHIHASIPCGSWLRIVKTDTKSTFRFQDREGRRQREKMGLGEGPSDRQKSIYRGLEGHLVSIFIGWELFSIDFWSQKESCWGQGVPSEGFSLKHRYGIAITLTADLHFGSKIAPPDSQWGAQSVPRGFPNRLKIEKK